MYTKIKTAQSCQLPNSTLGFWLWITRHCDGMPLASWRSFHQLWSHSLKRSIYVYISSACHLSSKVLVFFCKVAIQNYFSYIRRLLCNNRGGILVHTLGRVCSTKVLIEWWEEVADNPERLEGKDPSWCPKYMKISHTNGSLASTVELKWCDILPEKRENGRNNGKAFFFSWWVLLDYFWSPDAVNWLNMIEPRRVPRSANFHACFQVRPIWSIFDFLFWSGAGRGTSEKSPMKFTVRKNISRESPGWIQGYCNVFQSLRNSIRFNTI